MRAVGPEYNLVNRKMISSDSGYKLKLLPSVPLEQVDFGGLPWLCLTLLGKEDTQGKHKDGETKVELDELHNER